MIATGLLLLAHSMVSTPDLGKAAGRCRPDEDGPSVIVQVVGLKDRRGRLKLELYPANDADFLADDNVLVAAGKAFARVETDVPSSGPVELCIRAPSVGTSPSACFMIATQTANSRCRPTVSDFPAIRGSAFPGQKQRWQACGWGRDRPAFG
jgi:hypothetical protein